MFINFLRNLIRPKYETLNRLEIDAVKIIANYNYLKSLQKEAAIFPVLKANAYGFGLKEVCQILNYTSAPMIAVDSYPEAQIAYRYFKKKVLILNEMPNRAYHYTKLKRTEYVVYTEATLRYLARFKKKARIHLFVNSGMNREGIKDISKFISDNRRYLDKVEVSGFCTHLASADSRSILNTSQEDFFMDSLAILRAAGYFPSWIHLGNSAALFWSDNRLLTAFRPGIALYGYSPFLDDEEAARPLKPALEIYSKIISIQDVEVNESVSYNETYKASKSGQIAIIPFGYYEGLDRRLSNQAEFLIDGNGLFWARVAGRVCMNLTCLDVSNYNAQIGDEVQVVSSNPEAVNSVDNLASLMDTNVYEFLVKINQGIRRIVKNLPNN